MILDKLIERKDLKIYIDQRIKHLVKTLKRDMPTWPEKDREGIRRSFEGRIEELKTFRDIISNKRVREYGKRYWQEAATIEDKPRYVRVPNIER